MGQEKGSVALFTITKETTNGTIATGNSLQLPIISVTGGLDQNVVKSEALQGNRNRSMPDLDEKTVALTVVLQVDVRSIGYVLTEIFGSPTTTLDSPSAGHNTHVWKVPTTLPVGFTGEKFFGANSYPFQYLGCMVEGYSIEFASGGLLKMTLNLKGKDESQASRIDAAPYKYPLVPIRQALAEFYEGGGAIAKLTKFSHSFSNNLEEIRTLGTGGVVGDHLEGWADPMFSMTARFNSLTEYNKAINGTESSLRVKCPSPRTHASHYVQVASNELIYKPKSPEISGPGGVYVDLAAEPYYDNDAAASSVVWTVVNDVTSHATIPA